MCENAGQCQSNETRVSLQAFSCAGVSAHGSGFLSILTPLFGWRCWCRWKLSELVQAGDDLDNRFVGFRDHDPLAEELHRSLSIDHVVAFTRLENERGVASVRSAPVKAAAGREHFKRESQQRDRHPVP